MKRIYLMAALLAAPMLHGQGSQLPKYAVANLPSATAYPTYTVQVIDGSTANTCTVGGGAFNVICVASSGTWVPVSSPNLSFHNILSGTNSSADMTVSTGAALDYSGTGFIRANHIDGTISAGTGVTISGSGNTGSPYVISASGGGGSVNVNGSSVSNPNFNGTTPAAPAGATNKTFQVSGSNVSAYDYGVQYSPTTSSYYFISNSRWDESTDSLTNTGNVTATAISCDGTTCTATATNTLATSDWVRFGGTYSPSCLIDEQVPVSSASGSAFTFAQSMTTCTGSTSGTGGVASLATHFLVAQTSKMPFFSGHGTSHYIPSPSLFTAGGTVALYDTNYTTSLHPSMPAVTGINPTYVFMSFGFDDLFATPCSSYATLTGTTATAGSFKHLWAKLHTDGAIIVLVTEPSRFAKSILCSNTPQNMIRLQQWLVAQGPGSASDNAYVDYIVDAATPMSNPASGQFYSDQIHYSNAGNNTVASLINNGLASQASINLGQPLGQGPNVMTGNQFHMDINGGGSCYDSYGGNNSSLTSALTFCDTAASIPYININGDLNAADQWYYRSASSTVSHNLGIDGVWGWLSASFAGSGYINPPDTGLSRDSAGVIDVGNGNKQDASGSMKMTNLTLTGTCTGCVGTIPLSSVTAGASPSGTFDFSGATHIKLPTAAGYDSAATSEVGYDSTNKNWHIWKNGADTLLIPFPTTTVSGDCYFPQITGSTWAMVDAGGPCGTSGGGSAWGSLTSGTNTTMAAVVGSGASIGVTGTGTIAATSIGGITVTTTPAAGNVLTATSTSAATWQASSGSGALTNITSLVTPTNCTITGNLCAATGAVASITIAGIPAGHNNLKIVLFGTTSVSTEQFVTAQLNGDTGTNYAYASTNSNSAGGPTKGSANATATVNVCDIGGVNTGGGGTIYIPLYTNTTFFKNMRGNCSSDGATTAFTGAGDYGATWRSTAAVTSIKLTPGSGNFQTGTTVIVYAED